MNVLFDLDGTLTDPFEGITNCIVYALETLGRTPPLATDLRWAIGPPLLGSMEQLLGSRELAIEGLRIYRERFSSVGLFENRVYDGIPELLITLLDRDFDLFVATSKPTVYTVRILENFSLDGFFKGVFGSELDGTRTDKGELIAHLLEAVGLDRAETVMVGDRSHDIIGARINGLESIGVLYGYGTREELVSAGATWLAETPEDIAKTISG